jgi:hypothetical protein
MNKILIAVAMLSMSGVTLAAQDTKTGPVAPSGSATAQLQQIQDEDQKLEQDEQQMMKAVHVLQSDLQLQHQRNRERQVLIQKENKQWLHDNEHPD